MPSKSTLLSLTCYLCIVHISYALECYVCKDQEDNLGKCVQTIATCRYDEDVCLSEISWGSLPYFQEGALKQYYVSKRCASQDQCHKYRSSLMQYCTHIWYQDWKCAECCKGDRCNYYIISASSKIQVFRLLPISLLAFSLIYKLLY